MSESKADTTCQYCTVAQTKGRECSICTGHLCAGVPEDQSACSPCLIKAIAKKSLQKNDKGQFLDPAKRTPLKTCKCGEFLHPMNYDCFLKGINGDKRHALIR